MTTIHDIIDIMHSDPAGISTKFGIPIRTVYHWCAGTRKPPEYLICMMLNILLLERRLAHGNEREGLEGGMGADIGKIKETGQESKPENGTS